LLGTEGLDLFAQSIDIQAHIRIQMLFGPFYSLPKQ